MVWLRLGHRLPFFVRGTGRAFGGGKSCRNGRGSNRAPCDCPSGHRYLCGLRWLATPTAVPDARRTAGIA